MELALTSMGLRLEEADIGMNIDCLLEKLNAIELCPAATESGQLSGEFHDLFEPDDPLSHERFRHTYVVDILTSSRSSKRIPFIDA